jgi:alpha-L-arabinofuranosidase
MTRRDFTATLAASAFLRPATAQTSPLKARVKIDTDRTIGDIDPNLWGNFTEHLGRCIYGGIYEPGSPLSDSEGYRRDVLEASKRLHVTQLRYPGGNFTSGYHWMDGIGPADKRPERLEMAWGTTEPNKFGTHEFLGFTAKLGAEPYLCVNLGTGSWDEAQRWVEYCNHASGTEMATLRKRNGREKPWGVKYWGLGNEMDGPWQMGHRDADDYGKYALEAAKLMKWTDPGIRLIAAGSSNYGADWIGWNRTILQHLKNHIDYISLHTYVGNHANDYYEFLASSMDLDDRTRITQGLIESVLDNTPGNRKIYIAWDEYNVWYRARGEGKEAGRRILEERYNLEDALVIAGILNSFLNHTDIVKMANMAQLVNVIAPIFTNEQGLFLQTIYYPLELFATNARGKSLSLYVDGPAYKTKHRDRVPYLDTSAAWDNGTLVINAVNRHQDSPLEVEFQSQNGPFRGTWEVAEVNGPDIKAQNDFGVTKVETKRKTIQASGATLRYTLPPHSYTMLKGQA